MSRQPPRGLTAEEQALWARLAATVKPMRRVLPPPAGEGDRTKAGGGELPRAATPAAAAPGRKSPPTAAVRRPPPRAGEGPKPPPPPPSPGLDSHWDRRLGRASTAPDFTLDLHGHTLAQAHTRLDHGIAQAKAMGARLVLVITGKPRPVDAADRAERRGAIRAKVLDWLAAGPHAGDIAAVRKAHPRHGGEGALYLVLRRPGRPGK